MTKEEFKSRIEDIIDDNRIYGWDTVSVLIMEEIDKNFPFTKVDWEQRRYEIAKSAMNGILSNEDGIKFALSEAVYDKDERHTVPKAISQYAIECANSLIKGLRKYDHDKNRI